MRLKGSPRTAKRALYGNRAFCGHPVAILSDSPNLGSDYQSTLLALNQWLEAKPILPQWWMSLVGFPSSSLSGTSRLVASSSVFRLFSLSSEPLGSFTPTGAHSSSHRNSITSAAKMELRPPKLRPTTLRAMAKTSASMELCGRPFSACYTPQTAHSLTGNVSYHLRSHWFGHINTVTEESPHDRFFCFKRDESLIRPSSSAPWLRADTPAYLRKFVRAKDQAPVVPVQISQVIFSPCTSLLWLWGSWHGFYQWPLSTTGGYWLWRNDLATWWSIQRQGDQCRHRNIGSWHRNDCEPPKLWNQ